MFGGLVTQNPPNAVTTVISCSQNPPNAVTTVISCNQNQKASTGGSTPLNHSTVARATTPWQHRLRW